MVIQEELLSTFGADTITLQKSQFLFEENTDSEYYYQIVKGKIKLTNSKAVGGEFIQSVHEDGDSVGEIFLFSKYMYPVNAIVMENCILLRLERDKLLQLLESDFEVQMKFLHKIADRTYFSYVFLNSLTSEDATHQLLTLLNYLKPKDRHIEPYPYKIPYTRKELASLTGLRVETVIRTLKKMENDNIVKIIKGRVYY